MEDIEDMKDIEVNIEVNIDKFITDESDNILDIYYDIKNRFPYFFDKLSFPIYTDLLIDIIFTDNTTMYKNYEMCNSYFFDENIKEISITQEITNYFLKKYKKSVNNNIWDNFCYKYTYCYC